MKNREFEMAAALVAPEGSRRALSAGSLLVLEMLGNPLAQLEAEAVPSASAYHLAELLWVHEAPLDRVRAAACISRKNPVGVQQLVLEWVEAKPLGWKADALAWAEAEVARALACMAVHEQEGDSKNAPGLCSVSA